MAYHTIGNIRTKYYFASSTTTNGQMSVAVNKRGQYIGGYYATSLTAAQTAAGQLAIAVNGNSVAGSSAISVTTSTGNSSTQLPIPTANTYLAAGDVLSVTCSSCIGGAVTFAVVEF